MSPAGVPRAGGPLGDAAQPGHLDPSQRPDSLVGNVLRARCGPGLDSPGLPSINGSGQPNHQPHEQTDQRHEAERKRHDHRLA